MQCANCGFQNMPGSESCGRCRTSLGLATAVIDVHPPRASAARKRLRRLLPAPKALYQTRDALHVDEAADQTRRVVTAIRAIPPLPPLVLFIIPGLSHFYLKQRIRAHLFLWSYSGSLLWLLLFYGSTSPGFWLGMAFSIHSSALLDIVTQSFAAVEVRERMIRSLVVSAVLGIVLYLPALWIISELAQPHVVQTQLAQFLPGDVILVDRMHAPQRGDVVLYQVSYRSDQAQLGMERGERRLQYFAGENVDRILAMPGDYVQCSEGQLLVNGSPSAWQPLNPQQLPASLSIALGDGEFLIPPSGAPGIDLRQVNVWQANSRVQRGDIVGRAYLRSHPLSRLKILR